MKEQETKQNKGEDTRRAAYMLAKRDMRIRELEDRIRGYEEAFHAARALIAMFALAAAGERFSKDLKAGKTDVGERFLRIPKAAVREALAGWSAEVADESTDYCITFHAASTAQ